MKYWVYSGGQIYGPHPKEALASVPGFSAHSLVCPEGVTGDKPGDWSTADSVKELASVLLAGVAGGGSTSMPPRTTPQGSGLPSSFSSEPDFGILSGSSGSSSSEFSFDSLPGALRETPAESALNQDVKSYLQELNLKDRRIVSLEDELREAQTVFEKYQGEIARILDDNRRTFEQVHTHLTQKDIALEQASHKITTLEESLKLVRRPDQTLSETLLEMKREADQLRGELERTRTELQKVKEAPTAAAAPPAEAPKAEEPKAVDPKGGLKLGLKGGLGGLKPIGLSGGPGAKPPLMKSSLGVKPSLGLKLGAKPALEAPKAAELPAVVPQAQLPAPEAASTSLSTSAPAPVLPAAAAPLQIAPPVVDRPTLPPLDLVISPLQIPMPSWEAAAQAPIELSFPGTASAPLSTSAAPVPSAQPQAAPPSGGLAFRIPKKDLGVVGAPVDLKPGGAKPLSFAPPAAPAAPPLFTLTKKTLGAEGAASAPAAPGLPPGAKKLSFAPPAAPEAAKAVEDIFAAAAPPAEAPAAPPVFTLTKKTLGVPGAPIGKPLGFTPPAEALKAVEDIFAAIAPAPEAVVPPAPAAPPAFTLTKKTLGAPPPAPLPAAPAAKPISFQLPTAPEAPVASPPAFNLVKKTLGGPGAAKKLSFNPSLVPPAPAAPAPAAPPAFTLTKKTLGPAAVGPTLSPGPVAKPLSFKPAELAPLPEVPLPKPVEVYVEPVVEAAAPVVEAPAPVVEAAAPVIEPPLAKSPLEEALAGLSTVEAAAPTSEAPVLSEVEAPAKSPLEEALAQIQEAAPAPAPSAFKESSVTSEVVLPPVEISVAKFETPAPEPVAAVKPPEPVKPAEVKPEVKPTTVVALAPAKKEEPAVAAAPAKKKSRSTVVMAVIVALLVVGGLVTALMIVKDINEVNMAPVMTMPDLNAPAPGGQNYALPAPNPATQPAPQAQPAPGTQSQAPGASTPLSTGDRIAEPIQDAIRFVKSYRLDPGRGSIANWFDTQFLTTPGDGKEPEWSAVHLEGNKFTVQYRLSYSAKTAQMPDIYYVFEVDLAAQTLAGSNEAAKTLLANGKSPSRSPQQRTGGVAGVEPAGQNNQPAPPPQN